MTDQPAPGAPDPNATPATPPADPAQPSWAAAPGAPTPPPPPPLAPHVTPQPGQPDPSQPGWAAIPSTTPAPQAYGQAPMAPPAPARTGSKLIPVLVLLGIVGFLGVVLYVTRDNQDVFDMQVGLCFDVPTDTSVSTVTKRDCAEAHDAEVFHNAQYPDQDSYPISLSFENFVDEVCLPVFETYVGIPYEESETLTIGWFYPTTESWADNDRTVTCYVGRLDEAKLTKTVKGSNGL